MITLAASAIFIGSLLAVIRMDVIRLGPPTYSLPADALEVSVRAWRLPDGDPLYDYYSLMIWVNETVGDAELQPFSIDVSVNLSEGEIFAPWRPQAGDHHSTSSMVIKPEEVTLLLPRGVVSTRTSEGYEALYWSVQGERFLRSDPIFDETTNFYIGVIRVTEDTVLSADVEVELTWYYASLLQAYPVVSRSVQVAHQQA